MLYRHGDVLIQSIEHLPAGAQERPGTILARGELTGHSHRIQDPATVQLWQLHGEIYIEVTAGLAHLIHEEHKTIPLPKGIYKSWMQREYTPQAIRRVLD
ncbi:hypothetical protein [Deinococcus roseus]|uniref:Uncharacterized protein n=1 Tax=Deinococcus roseus TaxID=392414 RepID=A0ABQ2CVD4_9DEIO|nr:hypothetical protein [Deinococcus roseus]GGJ24218.1 hypothetical protein GCM10008938_07950 [Deinococcus roseus]